MFSPVSTQPEFEEQVTATLVAHDFLRPAQDAWLARAPGRLDVMGGNVDYTGGMVLQGLLRESIWIASQSRSDNTLQIDNSDAVRFGWTPSLELTLDDLTDEKAVRATCTNQAAWGRYVVGGLYFLNRFFPRPGRTGLHLFVGSDLPPNKGVSSSAALTIAALKACAVAWDIELSGVALATAGQWVENVIADSACGIMDQAAIVLGRKHHLLPLLCQPCRPSPMMALPQGVEFWGIDSQVRRSTTSAAYEIARAAAFMGYRILCEQDGNDVIPDENAPIPRWTDPRWHGYLSNLAPSEFRSRYERGLPESWSGREFLSRYEQHVDPFTKIDPDAEYPIRAAVRYATEENLRVRMVSALLQSGCSQSSLQLIGELLCQSHVAYADCGLGAEACDELVERAMKAGLLGAKMTGGGAGGVVALFGRTEDRHKVRSIARDFAGPQADMPYIFEGSSDGVDAYGVRTLQRDGRWGER